MPSDRDAEIARRLHAGFEAFNRGDYDAAAAMMHEDVEYAPVGGQAPIRGRDALRAWMEPSAWDRQAIEPLEITVVGNRILMQSRTSARGAGSGIEMQIESWVVLTIDDDLLVTRIETFFPHEEAEAREAAAVADPRSPG
jgi:ketosteroid isomerase-like protein